MFTVKSDVRYTGKSTVSGDTTVPRQREMETENQFENENSYLMNKQKREDLVLTGIEES